MRSTKKKMLVAAAVAMTVSLGTLFAQENKPKADGAKPATPAAKPADTTKPATPAGGDNKPATPATPATPAAGTATPAAAAGGETKTASGLVIKVVEEAKQPGAANGDLVWVHYTGKLENGEQFDSSVGGKPFRFELGKGEVIKGWDEGVAGMKVGEKRKLTIPAALGYGASGSPPKIPGGATLVFDVELIGIARPGK